MILCAVLSAAVWYFARHLDLYACDDSVDYGDLELKELRRKRDPKISSRQATPAARRRKLTPAALQRSGDVMETTDNDEAEEPEEVELSFNVLDISDHMEDSMEELSPKRRMSGVY
jgi:hypothetical protein